MERAVGNSTQSQADARLEPRSTPPVRIVALGNPDRGDDGAALAVAARFEGQVPVYLAGRPGAGLLELLPSHEVCLLLDVTWSGAPPGTLHRITLADLTPASLPDARVSTHGFGPGEAFSLARALGRPLPMGLFLGLEGESFGCGEALSQAVRRALPCLEHSAREFLSSHEPYTQPRRQEALK